MARTTRICRIARAKLNLALHVRGKRGDGYHELDSVFVHCVDGDELWVEPADAITLTITGPFAEGLSAGEDNLVMRAARAVHHAYRRDEPKQHNVFTFDIPPSDEPARAPSVSDHVVMQPHYGASRGAAITLVKNLPLASGIGGGSADAAATIDLLVALWDLPDDLDVMTGIAASLGADVAPCLYAWPKHVLGRGEDFEALHDQAYRDWPVLLVNPGIAVPTGAVFAGWDGVDRGALPTAPQFAQVIAEGRNDLEPTARSLAPVIGECVDLLAAQPGAFGARMSGSGATCFALFGCAQERDAAAQAIRTARPDWWTWASRLS
ncbi:MAG: 4-(cytidine 5'-diphospho)-2-C-methyl-D-erythritol kinase [Sphingomonadales bacterium]|nr:4-(cytidine 5'-diphospho)-2-C-methyl-D-erythritol kinase [Sphingomonadales bacterium]